jgi:hypothetical protein
VTPKSITEQNVHSAPTWIGQGPRMKRRTARHMSLTDDLVVMRIH